MIAVDRRAILGGMAAAIALPSAPRAAAPSQDVRQTLDEAMALQPAAALRLLAAIDVARLPPSAHLDLEAARAGLAIDAALADRFPAGVPGRSPYRVTPRTGAWLAQNPGVEAIDRDTAALVSDAASGIVLPRSALDPLVALLAHAASMSTPPVAGALDRQRLALITRRAVAPELPGLSRLPGGVALYGDFLRRGCGSDVEPPAALALLERERDRLLQRADRLFRGIAMTDGSVGMRYVALWRDARWLYPNDATGRALAVADMNRWSDAAADTVAATMDFVPAFCRNAAVRTLSPEEVASGREGYRQVPTPGRAGLYVVDLRRVASRPRWTLPGVVAHELFPGHMVQLGIEELARPHPLRLGYAAAFVEGWGIHAETLAAFADPHEELGHVHWLLFRVCRGIVDLNLHLHGWTPERCRGALVDWHGEPASFAPFHLELSRIAVEPGVRAGEALAWLAIRKTTLGLDGAALRSRHRAILAHGRTRTEALPTGRNAA